MWRIYFFIFKKFSGKGKELRSVLFQKNKKKNKRKKKNWLKYLKETE